MLGEPTCKDEIRTSGCLRMWAHLQRQDPREADASGCRCSPLLLLHHPYSCVALSHVLASGISIPLALPKAITTVRSHVLQ